MAVKKIEMRPPGSSYTDVLYPKTSADMVFAENGQTVESHVVDTVKHITPVERTLWTAKETPVDALKKVERTSYSTSKSNRDDEGIYTIVEQRRNTNNTLVRRSVLSGGISPLYTTRSISYYEQDGSTVSHTEHYALSYDEDDVVIKEVLT